MRRDPDAYLSTRQAYGRVLFHQEVLRITLEVTGPRSKQRKIRSPLSRRHCLERMMKAHGGLFIGFTRKPTGGFFTELGQVGGWEKGALLVSI
jgi:hypothetical protein